MSSSRAIVPAGLKHGTAHAMLCLRIQPSSSFSIVLEAAIVDDVLAQELAVVARRNSRQRHTQLEK
jgi:hypothetical protein